MNESNETTLSYLLDILELAGDPLSFLKVRYFIENLGDKPVENDFRRAVKNIRNVFDTVKDL